MAEKKLSVLITGNAKGAQKAFGELDKSAAKADKSTKKAGGGLSKLNGALLGFGAGAAIYGAFSAFDDAAKVMAQTEAVIKSTGGAANVTADEVQGMADALSKKSGIDDEAIQSGENLLLTFKNVRNEAGKGNDIFNQTTTAALDMSVAMGTDMTSASVMLGKALNDPTAGLSKLTRAGVTFTASQKEQIKALQASGDTLGAQKIILGELTSEFGGSAEAQATSLGKMKVSLDNLAESVGGALAPALTVAADGIGTLADAFGKLPQGAQLGVLAAGAAGLAWLKYGDNVMSAASTIKSGATGAIGAAKSMADAIGQIAATRGVSKGTAAIEVLKSSIAGIGPAAAAGAVGAAGFTAALVYMQTESDRAKRNMKDLQKAIQEGMSPGEAAAQKLTNTLAGVDGGFEDLAGSSKQFRSNMKEVGMTATEVASLISAPADEWESAAKRIANTEGMNKHQASQFVTNIDMMRNSVHDATEADKTLHSVQKELGVSAEGAAGKESVLGDKTGAAATEADESAAAQKRNSDALIALADSAKRATDNISNFYDATTAGLSSQIDAEAAIDAVSTSLKENGTTLDITTEKGRANQTAIIAAKDAQLGYAMTLRDQSGSGAAISSMVTYATKLHDTLRASGLTEDQTNQLIAQMKLTPKDIYTTFGSNATAAEQKANAVHTAVTSVPPTRNVDFYANTGGALANISRLQQAINSLGSSAPPGMINAERNAGRAKGGPVNAGQTYLVGEKGPELFTSNQSGTIIPNHDLMGKQSRIMAPSSGGGTSVMVNVTVNGSTLASKRELADAVRSGVRAGLYNNSGLALA